MFKQTSRSLRCPSQIARAAMHALEEHLPRITIVTLSGGLRLQRDLGSWKNLFRTMRDSESDRRLEDLRELSTVLIMPAVSVRTVVDEGSLGGR
mmetsp:Transcript_54592/g.144257  ORF Transcript_54592/g.144257 Transcript_54592/m.144257 type:complete len:94 (-) Transcript_54592:384-665(-)